MTVGLHFFENDRRVRQSVLSSPRPAKFRRYPWRRDSPGNTTSNLPYSVSCRVFLVFIGGLQGSSRVGTLLSTDPQDTGGQCTEDVLVYRVGLTRKTSSVSRTWKSGLPEVVHSPTDERCPPSSSVSPVVSQCWPSCLHLSLVGPKVTFEVIVNYENLPFKWRDSGEEGDVVTFHYHNERVTGRHSQFTVLRVFYDTCPGSWSTREHSSVDSWYSKVRPHRSRKRWCKKISRENFFRTKNVVRTEGSSVVDWNSRMIWSLQ